MPAQPGTLGQGRLREGGSTAEPAKKIAKRGRIVVYRRLWSLA
jgi:hypothetical protein